MTRQRIPECINRHPMTADNTYTRPDDGYTECKQCRRDAYTRWYAKHAAERNRKLRAKRWRGK